MNAFQLEDSCLDIVANDLVPSYNSDKNSSLEEKIRIQKRILNYWLDIHESYSNDVSMHTSRMYEFSLEHCSNVKDTITWLELRLKTEKECTEI